MDKLACSRALNRSVPFDRIDMKGLVEEASEKAPFVTVVFKYEEAV